VLAWARRGFVPSLAGRNLSSAAARRRRNLIEEVAQRVGYCARRAQQRRVRVNCVDSPPAGRDSGRIHGRPRFERCLRQISHQSAPRKHSKQFRVEPRLQAVGIGAGHLGSAQLDKEQRIYGGSVPAREHLNAKRQKEHQRAAANSQCAPLKRHDFIHFLPRVLVFEPGRARMRPNFARSLCRFLRQGTWWRVVAIYHRSRCSHPVGYCPRRVRKPVSFSGLAGGSNTCHSLPGK